MLFTITLCAFCSYWQDTSIRGELKTKIFVLFLKLYASDKKAYNLKVFDHQIFFLYYINGIQYHPLDSIIMQEDFVIKEMMFDTPKTKKHAFLRATSKENRSFEVRMGL